VRAELHLIRGENLCAVLPLLYLLYFPLLTEYPVRQIDLPLTTTGSCVT
jgi:hypothetical protein